MQYTYDDFLKAFSESGKEASDLIDSFPEDKLNTRPQPEKWSALEIMSHLVETGDEYMGGLNILFSKDPESFAKGSPPFRPGMFFRWFIRQVSPQNSRPLPTVAAFKPADRSSLQKEEVMERFLSLQKTVHTMCTTCKEHQLDMDRVYIKNPIIRLVRMSLTSVFGLMINHQNRHFKQIRQRAEIFSSTA